MFSVHLLTTQTQIVYNFSIKSDLFLCFTITSDNAFKPNYFCVLNDSIAVQQLIWGKLSREEENREWQRCDPNSTDFMRPDKLFCPDTVQHTHFLSETLLSVPLDFHSEFNDLLLLSSPLSI